MSVQVNHSPIFPSTYFTNETSLAVFKYNKLQGLVKEAVAPVTMPTSPRKFIPSAWCRVVQTHHKASRFDLFQSRLVITMGSQEGVTGIGPVVTVISSQHTQRQSLVLTGKINHTLELLLDFRGGELLAIVYYIDKIEAVLADDNDVGVFNKIIGDFNVRGFLGHTAVVKHVLVRVHT